MPEAPSTHGEDSLAGARDRGIRGILHRLLSRRAIVEDRSMEPAFLPGDRLLFDPSAYRTRGPRPGEIVVVSDPDGSGRLLLKEVAASEGSTVWVVRAGLVVGTPESGSRGPLRPPEDAIDQVRVPAGHLFVSSKRPSGTRDSRTFGALPCSHVVGKVWFRTSPRARRGPIGDGSRISG